MSRSLQVLIVEDNPADAELLTRELRRAGFMPNLQRVETESGFAACLHSEIDIILSDYSMPAFSGLRALEMLVESGLEIPFILISGAIGEDTAVTAIQLGASDYLIKDRLVRLGPAIHRALEQSRLRRERKQSEAALALFRTLVDQSSDTIEVIDPETSRFLDVSENGPVVLGYTRAEYLALRVIDIDPSQTEKTWADMAEKIRLTGCVKGESSQRRKDGTVFPVEFNAKWVSLDRDYIVNIVRDITGRRQAEERYRRLVESNAQGVVFRKSDGSITDANDAFLKIVGYTREDLDTGGLNWMKMTPPEFTSHDRRCVEELAVNGVCTPYEKEYIRKDGSHVPVLVGAAVFEYNPDEGVSFVLDLTERKLLEQQFLRAQRMESIGSLAGGIAHDLNNVLAPIMMALDLLKMKFTDTTSQDLLSLIAASAQHGADMVKQVLMFARGIEGLRIEVQLRHLIGEMERIVNETFLKHIEIQSIVPSDLWTVSGDPTQLHQVLINLCVNARDAMPDGGELTISAENLTLDEHDAGMDGEVRPGNYVLLQISDTGTGMPPEVIEKIFDPFFTTKEIGNGTGLGLSTTLAIVKSHSGFMRVESKSGLGTTFKVYLPAWDHAPSAATAELVAAMPRGAGELILVADDEASVREITRQTLEAFGYRVVLAADGVEAVAIYARSTAEIAVVITDMTMPVMDGLATIHVLRKINPAVRIIGASGLHSEGNHTRASAAGVRRFLNKPFTAEALLIALRQVIEAE